MSVDATLICRECVCVHVLFSGWKEADMSKKGGNKPKTTPKPPMENKGPKKK